MRFKLPWLRFLASFLSLSKLVFLLISLTFCNSDFLYPQGWWGEVVGEEMLLLRFCQGRACTS